MTPSKKNGLKIATFNANSLRARAQIVSDWLEKEKPDVLAVQETKVQDPDFPREIFESKGWNLLFRGQKSYNGVALISKEPLKKVSDRLYPDEPEEEARFLAAEWNGIRIVNTYVPQGFAIDSPKYQKKLKFLGDLRKYFKTLHDHGTPALWLGDLNVAPTEIDLSDPKRNAEHPCFHFEAREAYAEVLAEGWTDLFREKEKGPGHYTFWDYRQPSTFEKNLGWRIDHILGTKPMVPRLERIWVDKEPRKLEKPSDHTFLVAEFSE